MTGETDPVAPPSQSMDIHAALPHSELFIHPGGHMPHGEQEQGIFFEKIRSFFEKNGVRRVP